MSASPDEAPRPLHVLILAPTGADAATAHDVLARAGIAARVCRDVEELAREIAAGSGALVLAEEGMEREGAAPLLAQLEAEPPWSDLPVVLLTRGEEMTHSSTPLIELLGTRVNVSHLERPFRVSTFIVAVQVALRARARQYQMRDLLAAAAIERQKLQTINEQLQQFAFVASHDLQEPARMVSSYLDLLRRRYDRELPPKAREFVGYALDGARRMQQLIRDVLAYARAGSSPLREPISLPAILAEVRQNLQMRLDELHATLIIEPLPVVLADRPSLLQLFQNLVDNGLKYHAQRPPVVRVSARALDAGAWEFAVADNGIGIPAEESERIFLMFQRLHRRSEYSGTGIGLAICKKLVEHFGGRIWVDSAVGAGSTFRFTLPAALVVPPTTAAPRLPATSLPATQPEEAR